MARCTMWRVQREMLEKCIAPALGFAVSGLAWMAGVRNRIGKYGCQCVVGHEGEFRLDLRAVDKDGFAIGSAGSKGRSEVNT